MRPQRVTELGKKTMLIQKRDPAGLSTIIPQAAIIQAAFPTFLYKVSQDEDSIEEIITAVFSKTYDQAAVNEAKIRYNAGEI